MIFVLSPAKTLDFTPAPEGLETTEPEMRGDIARLAAVTRKLKPADLKQLMGISDKLAELNRDRFKAFNARNYDDGVPAALAFAGDVYDGLGARRMAPEDLAWAQDHLRILSGMYGLLRPLDRIHPYRLEMGIRLATDRGHSLYDYWGDKPARALNKAARGQPDRTVINLASQEYFGAVDRKALKAPVVSCLFKEEKDGLLRVISFYAKTARGMMARWATLNRIEAPQALKDFDVAGYRFRPELSDKADWVFTRPQPPGVQA